MLAVKPSVDKQVACRLNQPMNPILMFALDPQGRPFSLHSTQPAEVWVNDHCYHLVLPVAPILYCLTL